MMPLLLLFIWILTLILFHKIKMNFLEFIFGAVGIFCFLMYFFRKPLEIPLETTLTYITKIIGSNLHLLTASPKNQMITIYYKVNAVSFFVDYECSGFIESCVYASILLFYPIYRWYEKIKYLIIGIIYILACNIFRVLIICLITKIFGGGIFFFTHTVFARFLFFMLTVILYYYVFTVPHITNQKVGDFKYD